MAVSPTGSEIFFLPIPPDEEEEELVSVLPNPHEGAISSISSSDRSSRGSTGLAKLFESFGELDIHEEDNTLHARSLKASPEVPDQKARRVFQKAILEEEEVESEEDEEERYTFHREVQRRSYQDIEKSEDPVEQHCPAFWLDQEAHHLQQAQRRPFQDIEEDLVNAAESKKPRKDPPCALKYHSRVYPAKYKEKLFQARQRKKDNQL